MGKGSVTLMTVKCGPFLKPVRHPLHGSNAVPCRPEFQGARPKRCDTDANLGPPTLAPRTPQAARTVRRPARPGAARTPRGTWPSGSRAASPPRGCGGPRADPCGGPTGFGAEPLVRHLGALVRGGALQLEGVVGHEGHNLLLLPERHWGLVAELLMRGRDPGLGEARRAGLKGGAVPSLGHKEGQAASREWNLWHFQYRPPGFFIPEEWRAGPPRYRSTTTKPRKMPSRYSC